MNNLRELEEKIKNCKKCPLWEARNNAVPGEGKENAKIMLIGEAPGYWEDIQARPFVGRAGKLLDSYLSKIGLNRKEVYITNVVKCRPPNNRTPWKSEIKACFPYLEEQISIINPIIIVTLGNTAGATIFEKYGLKWKGITQEHGKIYKISTIYGKKLIIPMFHPAAVLRRKELNKEMEEAFEKLKGIIQQL